MSPLLGVLAFGQFTFVTSVFIVIGILPAMAAGFGLPISTVAGAVGLFSIVYAISGPILSAAAGHLNRKWLLVLALLIFSATNVVAATTHDFKVLLSMRLLGAACDGFYAATATALAAALAAPERRGRALSIVNSGITIAFVIGVPLGAFIGFRLGWRATFWFLAALGVLTAIGLSLSLPSEVRLSKVTSLAQRIFALMQPPVLVLVFVTIFSYAGVFSVYTFLAPALKQITHVTGSGVSGLLMAFGISTIFGNWAGGLLTDLWKPGRTMMIGFLCLVVLLLAFEPMMQSFLGAFVLVSLLGFIHYTALTPLLHRFTLADEAQADVVIGLCFAAFYVGIALASYSGGYLLNHFGIGSIGFGAAAYKLAAAGALAISLAFHCRPSKNMAGQAAE